MFDSDLKNLIEKLGGSVVIVEEGQPKYVVLKFDLAKNLLLGNGLGAALSSEEKMAQEINREIESLQKEDFGEAG